MYEQRVTWRGTLRRHLVLHLSAKVKADRMAVLETQEPGQFVVSVLMSGHSNVGLRSTA